MNEEINTYITIYIVILIIMFIAMFANMLEGGPTPLYLVVGIPVLWPLFLGGLIIVSTSMTLIWGIKFSIEVIRNK